MADKSVDLNASDLFGLPAEFHEQSSTSPHERTPANIMDANGNMECETMINAMTNYTNPWAYCNGTPDIKTDAATFLTQFGDVQNSKIITGLTISFTAGAYATGDITGHNHDDNAHAAGLTIGYADVSTAVPTSAGFGVPDFGITLGTNATPVSATLTFSMNHVDREDANGDHWVGKNLTPTVTLSIELLGIPTSTTVAALESDMTGWTIDTNGPTDGNGEFDGFVITAHRYFDLAIA